MEGGSCAEIAAIDGEALVGAEAMEIRAEHLGEPVVVPKPELAITDANDSAVEPKVATQDDVEPGRPS